MPPTGENLSADAISRRHRVHSAGERRASRRSALTATTAVPIGSIATGATRPAGGSRGAAGAPRPRRAGAAKARPAPAARQRRRTRRGAANAGPLGVTVAGDGEELRAGDRRDAAQSGSRRLADGAAQLSGLEPQPADADHAATTSKDLQLVWSWAMNEGQGNEPTPLVHNGVIYLVNTEQHRAGARRADRRSDLGEPRRAERADRPGRDAQHGDLPGQGVRRDHRRAAGRARRAHRHKVWDTTIADRAKGYANTAGPIVDEGQGRQRPGRLRSLRQRWLLDQRLRRRRPASSSGSSTPSRARANRAARPGASSPTTCRVGGETWIAGSYDPDLDLTYWGVAQAKPWMRGEPRHDATSTTCSTPAPRSRCDPKDGTLAWHYQHAPGESLDLDEVFERVLVDIGDQKVVFTIGKAGILWKLDRRNGKFLGYKETVFQNVFESIDPKTGDADVSRRHPRAADRPMGRVVPEHRGRPQLAGDELSCRRAAC